MQAGTGITLLTLALAQGLMIDSGIGDDELTSKRINKGCPKPCKPEPGKPCKPLPPCPLSFLQVCGTDEKTYNNMCELRQAACSDPSLDLAYRGKCSGPYVEAVVAEEEEDEEDYCDNIPDRSSEECKEKSHVCGSDGETYKNKCRLDQARCNNTAPHPGLEVAYEGKCGTVPVRNVPTKVKGCEVCQRIFRPVCGSDGVTYNNECNLRAQACKTGDRQLVLLRSGACGDGDMVSRVNFPQAEGGCPSFCTLQHEPVCGSDGMTYSNPCQLEAQACREALQGKQGLEISYKGECAPKLGAPHLSHLTASVLAAAEAGVRQLAGRRGEDRHYKLDFVETAKTQVVSGTNYLLTVLVGQTNCSLGQEYSSQDCTVVSKDQSLRCDLVVYKSLQTGAGHVLTKEVCGPAFDFRAVCIGCPQDGSAEAESARVLALYVVRELTRTAAQAGVLSHHLGLLGIKRFMKSADGQGGFQYVLDVEVAETACGLEREYDIEACPVEEREDPRMCTAEVYEKDQPRKLPRGVELRRIEVTSTICQEMPANLQAAASVDDKDVIQVAKAVTLEMGDSFGTSLWLVTRVVSASREVVAGGGAEYALTLAMAESGCLREEMAGATPSQVYGGTCTVVPEAETKTCQVVVTRSLDPNRAQSRSALGSVYQFLLKSQLCAERKVCPRSCPEAREPVCGTDGVTYPSPCHLQRASCSSPALPPLAIQAPGYCSRQAALLRHTVLCSGCPQEGSRENIQVREAAEAAALLLSRKFNNTHYFALDSITDVQTQVVAGTNYFLTVTLGESDCPLAQDFSAQECVINLEHENNVQCRVVVHSPLGSSQHFLSQHSCRPVPVAEHVKRDCNLKCRKVVQPVCGALRGVPTTFLNPCLMKAAACIAQTSISPVADTMCELEPEESEAAAARVAASVRDKFPGPARWSVGRVEGATRVEGGGVKVVLTLRETKCGKFARSDAECAQRAGLAERTCSATVREDGGVRGVTCDTGLVTRCAECGQEEVEVAKWAVRKITSKYSGSRQWALQHLQKASKELVPGKYVRHTLALHMTESSCTMEVPNLYSSPACQLRAAAPDNFCEVTVLQSLRSRRRRLASKTCAGYNIAQFF